MGVRVLIVDDRADARMLTRLMLAEHADIEIVGEADGAESALAQIDGAAPDVVLLDAVMPVVDGYELAPQLAGRRPGAPIVMLTALVDDAVTRRAAAAGVAECLEKGDFDALADTIRRLAAGDGSAPA